MVVMGAVVVGVYGGWVLNNYGGGGGGGGGGSYSAQLLTRGPGMGEPIKLMHWH